MEIWILTLAFVTSCILLWRKTDQCKELEARLSSEKVIVELTNKEAARSINRAEQAEGALEQAEEAFNQLHSLQHDYALKSLVVRQQVERINFLTRSKHAMRDSLHLAQLRVAEEVKRGNALSEQCQHTARKLQEYRDTVAELLSYAGERPAVASKHPRLVKILRALDDVHNDRI